MVFDVWITVEQILYLFSVGLHGNNPCGSLRCGKNRVKGTEAFCGEVYEAGFAETRSWNEVEFIPRYPCTCLILL